MKYDLENYILENIESGNWKINKKIPIEQKLIELSGLSKMTVRKIIEKLKEREILYSIQGRGVFVSPFFKHSKIDKLTNILGATKVTYLPSSSKIPSILLKRFNEKFEIAEENIITFVKLYFIKDEIIGYSINWLNNEDKSYVLKNIIAKREDIFERRDFNKIINIHKLEETSSSDKNILLTTFEYIPTIYSYFIKRDRNIVMMRIAKIRPKYYNTFEIKNR